MSTILTWAWTTFIQPYYEGWVRHTAAAWAVWIVAHGYFASQPDAEKQITGALLFGGAILWSMIDKNAKKILQQQVSNLTASLSTNPQASPTPPA